MADKVKVVEITRDTLIIKIVSVIESRLENLDEAELLRLEYLLCHQHEVQTGKIP